MAEEDGLRSPILATHLGEPEFPAPGSDPFQSWLFRSFRE